MRVYKVIAGGGLRKICGSMSEVSAAKKELVEEGFKKKEIEVEEAEIESGKPNLLSFMNSLIVEVIEQYAGDSEESAGEGEDD
jgi:hypothetical protein